MLIQSTTATNAAHRVEKARQNKDLHFWLFLAFRGAHIHGWVKRKNRWKVRVYELWVEDGELCYSISGGEGE